jgi:hypothetical protein
MENLHDGLVVMTLHRVEESTTCFFRRWEGPVIRGLRLLCRAVVTEVEFNQR